MEFELVKYSDLNRDRFVEHSTWAQYYEPDDIETLSSLGYSKEHVKLMIEFVGWSDDYWFPIPDETEVGLFQFEHRRANLKTPSGKVFDGYVINNGHSVCLFGKSQEWVINLNLLDLLQDEICDLRIDLGMDKDEELLPLEVKIIPKNKLLKFGNKS